MLAYSGIDKIQPGSVALDVAGNLYIADEREWGRVVKLEPGASSPTVLPFTGIRKPVSVAVDNAGNVYVTDYGNNRVLKLAAGSNTQVVLPFSGLDNPGGLAVDASGQVYVTYYNKTDYHDRVVKLPLAEVK